MVGRYLPGQQVLAAINQAREHAQSQVDAAAGQLAQLDQETKASIAQRGEALVELARLYLPDISGESVQATFAEIRGELADILANKERRERELRDAFDASLDTRSSLQHELDQVTDKLNACVKERDRLEDVLATKLEADAEFKQLSAQAIDREEELHRYEARVKESQSEAAEKLPAYEQSRLFKYLIDRKYGSTDYKYRGLTRRLDRWVARIVNFDKAKKSYDFLRLTTEMMVAEVARLRDEFEELLKKVEAIEQRYSEEIGLTKVLGEGVELGKKRDSLVTRINDEQERRQQLELEVKALATADNDFYRQAFTRLQQFLGSMNESALAAKTRSTATPHDDRLFSEITALNDRLDAAHRQSEVLSANTQYAVQRASGLAELARRFRAAEYDSSRSMFPPNLDLTEYLSRYLRGSMSIDAIWNLLQQHQEFAPTWAEQHGGRSRSVIDSEFGYVMMRVLAEVAGAVISHSMRGGGGGGGWSGGGRPSSSPAPSIRRPSGGGFTRGRGF